MYQFILKIVVMRNDDISHILTRMAMGTIIGLKTLEEAEKTQKEFHQMASVVIAGLKGRDENYYGFSVIISEDDRTALQRTIMDLRNEDLP